MLDFHELTTDAQITAAFPLMCELRPQLFAAEFFSVVRRQQKEGYRLIGGFDGAELVVLAGVRDGLTLGRGPHLFVDDLVTRQSRQRGGHGKAMVRWLAEQAASRGFARVYLDSRDTALGFYRHIGFQPLTTVTCWIDAATAGSKSADALKPDGLRLR